VVSDCLYVQDAMYSSYTSILLVVVTHCCLHSRYQQAEIGRAGTSRHQLLTDIKIRKKNCPFPQQSSSAYKIALSLINSASDLRSRLMTNRRITGTNYHETDIICKGKGGKMGINELRGS
jgi:hypothetical protein